MKSATQHPLAPARKPHATARCRGLAHFLPLLLGLLLFGSAPLLLTKPAEAQEVQTGERSFTNRYARPGRPTMTVYLWGEAGTTGIWQVERETGLIELLSAARVPGLGSDNPEFNRRVLVNIYRQEGESRRQIYQRRLEELVQGVQDYPSLQENDIVEIRAEQSRRLSFSTIAQYIGTASSIVLLLLRLDVL